MVVKAALSSCHVQNNPRKSTTKQPTEILLNKRVQSRDALWYSRIVKDGDLVRAADWCGDSFKILHEDRRCIRWLNSVSRLKVSDVAVVLELFSHTKNVFSSLRTKLLLKSRTTAYMASHHGLRGCLDLRCCADFCSSASAKFTHVVVRSNSDRNKDLELN